MSKTVSSRRTSGRLAAQRAGAIAEQRYADLVAQHPYAVPPRFSLHRPDLRGSNSSFTLGWYAALAWVRREGHWRNLPRGVSGPANDEGQHLAKPEGKP